MRPGGSSFAGLAFPFVRRKIKEGKKTRIVAVEPASCPSLTQGELRYDFGDTAEPTPLMVSHCLKLGLIEAQAYPQMKVFGAALQFARDRRRRR